jgi:hypothetical protein
VQNAKDYSSKPNIAPILKLRTDNGSEFAGDFAKLLDEQDIEHDRVEAGTHAQLARLDRFHCTLRMMIGEIFSVRDSHVWYDVLPNLIDNYNARPSRSLALGKQLRRAPEDIGPTEDAEIREHDLAQVKKLGESVDASGVGPGTRVRLQYSKTKAGDKDKFKKSHENSWTTEIYTILKRTGPNSFRVDVPPGEIRV